MTKAGAGGPPPNTRNQQSKERMFDVDNTSVSNAQHPDTFRVVTDPITDPISCITVSDKFLVIGRRNGGVQRYVLPHLSPENVYNLKCEPHRISLNCTSTRLAVIDSTGTFTMYDLEVRLTEEDKEGKSAVGDIFGSKLSVEKRDVWDMLWAADNDELIAVMEKTKMLVFRGEAVEDPVVSLGYLASFRDLEVRDRTLIEWRSARQRQQR